MKNQFGIIRHWQSVLVFVIGLALTCLISHEAKIHLEQKKLAIFEKEADQLFQYARRQILDAQQTASTIGELWPLLKQNPATITRISNYFPNLISLEVIHLENGRFSIIKPELELPWYSAPDLLSLPEVSTTLNHTTALQKLVTGPITRINQQTVDYTGEIRWFYPTRDEEKNIIVAVGFDFEQLTQSISEKAIEFGITLKLFDLKQYSTDPLVELGRGTQTSNITSFEGWKHQKTYQLAEREWLVQATPGDQFFRRFPDNQALTLFIAGSVISVLFGLLTRYYYRSRF